MKLCWSGIARSFVKPLSAATYVTQLNLCPACARESTYGNPCRGIRVCRFEKLLESSPRTIPLHCWELAREIVRRIVGRIGRRGFSRMTATAAAPQGQNVSRLKQSHPPGPIGPTWLAAAVVAPNAALLAAPRVSSVSSSACARSSGESGSPVERMPLGVLLGRQGGPNFSSGSRSATSITSPRSQTPETRASSNPRGHWLP